MSTVIHKTFIIIAAIKVSLHLELHLSDVFDYQLMSTEISYYLYAPCLQVRALECIKGAGIINIYIVLKLLHRVFMKKVTFWCYCKFKLFAILALYIDDLLDDLNFCYFILSIFYPISDGDEFDSHWEFHYL